MGTILIYIISFITFIAFLVFVPNAIRNGYIRKMSDEYYSEDNANSKNETAGNLIAKYIYLNNMGTTIKVLDSLLDGDSYYDIQGDEINIGKEIDKSMNIYAVAECFHELGHARQMLKFKNPRRKVDYINSLVRERNSIPYLSLIGMSCFVIASLAFMVTNEVSKLFIYLIVIGLTMIGLVFKMQIDQVKHESEASNLAIEMMIEQGFNNTEISKAQDRLDKCLKTYKAELVINSLKWLGVVLWLVCMSAAGPKKDK